MHSVFLFVEDFGQQTVISTILECLAQEYGIEIVQHPFSVRGGQGRMVTELKEFMRDLKRGDTNLPDLLIIGRDANCKGFVERRNELVNALGDYALPCVLAIPDPHIERWLLVDSAAFKAVLGKGCSAPDLKCDRDRYKSLLSNAVRGAGLTPLLGGMEHAADIVKAMNLSLIGQQDDSLKRFLNDLHSSFRSWKTTETSD